MLHNFKWGLLNCFLYLTRANKNLEICMLALLEQFKKSKLYWSNFIGSCLNKWIIFSKISCSRKTAVGSHIVFDITVTWIETYFEFEEHYFKFLHAFNFTCTKNKEASTCQKNGVMYWHNICHMTNSFMGWGSPLPWPFIKFYAK